ncbi:DciA family protein [Candidatus Uabimicrobium sp. HlEnr_7]|uniref:DciA family protein n=1 Tax=Candidatus Uabimicrobium helgolandensis TaxID=3095367 RepID=UPI003555D41D
MNNELWWKNAKQPVGIGTLIDQLFTKNKIIKREDQRIVDIWHSVNDEETIKRTKVVKYLNKKLYVLVDSSAYMFEIQNFKKKQILKKIASYNREVYISNIIFQVGDIKGGE